ncbi:MAG: DUF1302 family protein [Dissulfuribacterales bacterium]
MQKIKLFTILWCLFVFFILTGAAEGFRLNDTMEFNLKVQTRASIATEDVEGYTVPGDIDAGELVQHRNLCYIEFNHDLKNFDFPYKTRVKYHLLGRFLYEGIYDYGPNSFQDVKDQNEDEINDFRKESKLREGYVDISTGALFTRIGRQNLSWGETDIFRVVDQINPLDNTYGGIFEDLDDRRIPLDMIRLSYNLGKIGTVSSFTFEGFASPGFIENKVAPMAPYGTRYSAPSPDLGIPVVRHKPKKNMRSSRFGIRATGVIGDNFNYAITHMRTYLDTPSVRLAGNLFDPSTYVQEIVNKTVDITGASLNFYESFTDTVIRSEVALYWNEPVFMPNFNGVYDFDPLTGDFTGKIPDKKVIHFVTGFDKNLWIRPLNRTQTFFVTCQYLGTYVRDYDEAMAQAVPVYPEATGNGGLGVYPRTKRYEQAITGIVSTSYWHGNIEPQIAVAYDVRGAWFIQPQVIFKNDPWRFLIQYSTISGNFTNFGVLGDRDQFTCAITLQL